jgi:hypothetical protein
MTIKRAVLIALGSVALALAADPATPKVAEEIKPVSISREAMLEFQLIQNQADEAQKAIQGVANLLQAPIEQAKQAAIARECKRAGIVETETETCQIDIQANAVRRAPRQKAAKEK